MVQMHLRKMTVSENIMKETLKEDAIRVCIGVCVCVCRCVYVHVHTCDIYV